MERLYSACILQGSMCDPPYTSAGNFVDLVTKNFYDGMDIQRADGFVVQTGKPANVSCILLLLIVGCVCAAGRTLPPFAVLSRQQTSCWPHPCRCIVLEWSAATSPRHSETSWRKQQSFCWPYPCCSMPLF